MLFICRLLVPVISAISVGGILLELTSPAGTNPIDTSESGVDISTCTSITFQLRSCFSAHVWLGDGTGTGSYEIAIGIDDNRKTALRPCEKCWQNTTKKTSTMDILECDSFRAFWLSWANNRISFGEGNHPSINVVFDESNPNIHEIRVLAFVGWYNTAAVMRLGDDARSRFEIEADNAVFDDLSIDEMRATFPNCILNCHNNNNCGMFSYNRALGACALFDHKTSLFVLKTQTGWRSWKMRYCWP